MKGGGSLGNLQGEILIAKCGDERSGGGLTEIEVVAVVRWAP